MSLGDVQNDALRKREKRGLERPDDDVRLLDERSVFRDEEWIHDELAAELVGSGAQALEHCGRPLGDVDENVTIAEHADVIGGSFDLDGARAQEPMTIRRATRA